MTAGAGLWAMGDPQAPFAKVKAVLAHHGLLDDRGAIAGRLLSIGDHFDWGSVGERKQAADDGEAMLAWLAGHDASRVVLIAGNHDLARVGELNDVSDATFAALQLLADKHYFAKDGRFDDEVAFFKACNFLPSTEMVARDLSAYRHAQHVLVKRLLLERRMRLAHAENGLLFTHAGITRKALVRIGVDDQVSGGATAEACAEALNRVLDEAVDRHLRGPFPPGFGATPLLLPGLHRPADAISEGDGVLYHRPTHVAKDQWLEPRRYDPRRLPRGLWQVVGHVRDKRCVSSLKGWSEPKEHAEGRIRHLISRGNDVVYRHGPPPPRTDVAADAAVVIFIDGAMHDASVESYQLLNVASV